MPIRWAQDDSKFIVVNGKDYTIISIKELYEKCLAEAGLFQALINNLDATLESHQYAMHKKCYAVVKEAFDLFKQGKPIEYGRGASLTSAEVQTWINDADKWMAWQSGRESGGGGCPWGHCGPVLPGKKLAKKRIRRR
jgi:hypothetical protein